MSKLRGPRPPATPPLFDLTCLDGDIIIEGLEPRRVPGGTQHTAARLTRAQVFSIVKFSAELWPDQVTRIVSDVHRELVDLQPKRATAQHVDQPEEAGEEHQAADLDELRVRGEHPQQQTEHGEDERPDGDQHARERSATPPSADEEIELPPEWTRDR